MSDTEVLVKAYKDAGVILAEYLEPGRSRDAAATIDRLIQVLDSQQLAAVVERLEA